MKLKQQLTLDSFSHNECKCEGKGFMIWHVKEKAENGISVFSQAWQFCTCECGKQLPSLWDKYPAWQGAPYDFFGEE